LNSLTADRIAKALYYGCEYEMVSTIKKRDCQLEPYKTVRNIQFTYKEEPFKFYIDGYFLRGELLELEIYLKKETRGKITVFSFVKNADPIDKTTWIYDGVWKDITKKFVEEMETKLNAVLKEFEVAFRLPSVLK
jgi:hypothetical protein